MQWQIAGATPLSQLFMYMNNCLQFWSSLVHPSNLKVWVGEQQGLVRGTKVNQHPHMGPQQGSHWTRIRGMAGLLIKGMPGFIS